MKCINIKKTLGLLIMFMLIPLWAVSQNITIKGNITDATGEPIPGVNILQVGTTNGIISDLYGNYSLTAPSNAKLNFTFVGYTPQTIAIAGKQTINVVMQEDSKTLDEVVVVGYGSIKKTDISGSVASVNREEMMKKSPQNVAQGLRGSAPGVMVMSKDGAPDGFATIRVRGVATINGSADPLFVVDGVQVGTNANFLNPSDIESIEVLKDASATAIYGSRGANGVVMITTKHGTKGVTHLTFSANWDIQTRAQHLNTGDADQYAASVRQARENDGNALVLPIFSTAYDGKRKTIDWQKEMTHTTLKQQYDLSVSGGTDKSQSLFSVGYLDNDGIVVNTNYKRLSARANVKTKVADFIEVGGDVNFVHEETLGSNRSLGNNGNLSSLRDMAFLTPTMDYTDNGTLISPNVVNADGTYGTFLQLTQDSEISKGLDSPYAIQMTNDRKTRTNQIFASAYLDLKLLKGLNFKTVVSYNFYAKDYTDFDKVRSRYNNGKEVTLVNYKAAATFTMSPSQNNSLAIENYFSYNWKNDSHNLTLMAGNSVSNTFGNWQSVSAQGFPTDDIRNISLTTDISTKTSSGAYDIQTRFISYFGRAIYSLMDKYILTGTVRRDGSSNFGTGNRWGTFPSAALAWRVSQEDFMKNNPVVNNLKFRLGWGRTGNAGNATNLSVAQLGTNRVGYYFNTQGGASSGYSTANGYAPLNIIDTNLKWETNEQWNAGIDLGLFNNRFNITADYFIRTSNDLLLYQSLRPSTGFSQVYTNFGKIRNKGLELSLNYNQKFGDWAFGATLTGSTLKNKVIECGSDLLNTDGNETTVNDSSDKGTVGAGIHWDNHSICREGYAVGSYYGYQVEGIFQNQTEVDAANAIATGKGYSAYQELNTAAGDFKYKDMDKNGHIDENDMTILGNGFPDLNYGLTLNASYKNWDFSVYMYGVLGQDILSYSAMKLSTVYPSDDGISNILKSSYNEAWTAEKGGNTIPRLTISEKNYNTRTSSAWVKNGDFLKINNIQIGYTFSENLLKPLRLQSARIFASVHNLACISGYNKYGDPEVGQGSVIYTGLDTGRYPMPRTYSLGLNVTF